MCEALQLFDAHTLPVARAVIRAFHYKHVTSHVCGQHEICLRIINIYICVMVMGSALTSLASGAFIRTKALALSGAAVANSSA